MKPATPALRALLASRQFYKVDLYTFTLVGGAAFRYTTGDADIVANGFPFSSKGPQITRRDGGNNTLAHWKIGVEVDSFEFDIVPKASDRINGVPWLVACRQGVFDGAEVQWERAFMPTYGDVSAGTIIMNVGRVAEADGGRTVAHFIVNSHLELLNVTLPRDVYQAGCQNTLFDASCGLDRSAYAVAGTVLAGSSAATILASVPGYASGWFDQGSLAFTSGANVGFARSIKAHAAGSPSSFALLAPFPNPPAAGDGFTVLPGCDRVYGGGCLKFANQPNFRGQPTIPVPETLV